MNSGDLHPGMIIWADLDPTVGREQAGRRPALVIASDDYLSVVDTLAIVVPLTKINRGWPNHISISGPTGLSVQSWALTEQVRTISRQRISAVSGQVSANCLATVRMWVSEFVGATMAA